MENLKKRLDKLYKKYPDYVSFTYTMGKNKDGGYEKYNIYTPVINHNEFTDKDEFYRFLDMLTNTTPLEYKRQRLERLKDNLYDITGKLEDTREDIARLEMEIEEEAK